MSLSRPCSRCQPRHSEERSAEIGNRGCLTSTMNCKDKTGVLLVTTALCAIVLIIAAACNLVGIFKLSSQEEQILAFSANSLSALDKAIHDVRNWSIPAPASSWTKPTWTSPTGGIPATPFCGRMLDADKFDCHPEENPNEQACIERGCCWNGSTPQKKSTYQNPAPVNIPRCYFPANGYRGYRIKNVRRFGGRMELKLERQFPSGLPRDEKELIVTAIHYDYKTARVTIESASRQRWVPPLPPIADKSTEQDVGFEITLEGEDNSTLAIYRKDSTGNDNRPLFAVALSTLIFSDQFLQISTPIPSEKVYGLGEMKGPFLHSVNWTRRILFNKDQPPRFNRALYGAHSLMVNLDEHNKASGVFIKNSNAMDVVLQPQPAATFRTIGGIFDFFIFMGPTPGDVFAQYQHLVGLPAMIPYWSLGFHLCRYGYWTLNKTIETYERNIQKDVPLVGDQRQLFQLQDWIGRLAKNNSRCPWATTSQISAAVKILGDTGFKKKSHFVELGHLPSAWREVQWNDIDYMDRFNMFTYNKQNYSGLPEFVDRVHADGRKYMMIFDPAVSGSEAPGTYRPYDLGLKMDIFVKNVTGQVVPYKVWNTHTSIFPDFSHPRIDEYWTTLFSEFHKKINFDGAWIDMNEPSNQLNGTKLTKTCPDTRLDRPPVLIGGEALYTYTACMSDRMYLSSHYDLHNLYAHLEARATYRALASIRPGKRPFIISRASSPGQGLWSGHWTGDISSSWADLRQSIPDIINFAMYGMPMLGADVCGFLGDTQMELCARWQAVGAFYPFTRNHNDIRRKEQDPAFLGGDVLNATITTLQKKYLFAPYLYTLFYRAHVFGETVVRGMMFNFVSDPNTHSLDEQFMWGEGLLIAPALHKDQKQVEPYLPKGIWYHYNDNGRQLGSAATGSNVTLPAPLHDINLIIRGGHIIPAQDTSGVTLSGNRNNSFILFVAMDERQNSHGQLFWDDGDSIATIEKDNFSLIELDAQKGYIITRPIKTGYTAEPVDVATITVFGAVKKPTQILVNGINTHSSAIEYNDETKLLQIQKLHIDLLNRANVIEYS